MGYILLKNGIYWGYCPLTNLLLTPWDIQVPNILSQPGVQELLGRSGDLGTWAGLGRKFQLATENPQEGYPNPKFNSSSLKVVTETQ